MKSILSCLFVNMLIMTGVIGMNASFYPGIIPDQSDEFYKVKESFYEAIKAFDINDCDKTLKKVGEAYVACDHAYDSRIENDGGMCFIKTYTDVARALSKLVEKGQEALSVDERRLLKIQMDNPCYSDFGHTSNFKEYVLQNLK